MINYISATVLLLVVFADVKRNGHRIVLNPFFWASVFSFFYVILPSLFVDEINLLYSWSILAESIIASNFVTFGFACILAIVYCFNLSNKVLSVQSSYVKQASPIIILIWWTLTVYILYALLYKISIGNEGREFFIYDGKFNDPFKIKNIAYALIVVSVCMFFDKRRFWVFIPNILIGIVDFLDGSRTSAFVSLVPIYVCAAVYAQSLFVLPLIIFGIGMSVLGVFRMEHTYFDVPIYIDMLGEFRETYIPLPLLLRDSVYIGAAGFDDFIATISLGILQPFRDYLSDNYIFTGRFIADYIDRGYGLASNIIIEPFIYGYVVAPLVWLFFLVWLVLLKHLMCCSSTIPRVVFACVSIICLRLTVREGFASSFGLFLLIVIFYTVPLLFVNKIRRLKPIK